MSKETQQSPTKFRIISKKPYYRQIGAELLEHDQEQFFQTTGIQDFQDLLQAVSVYGEVLAECSDEERLRALIEAQGYELEE